MRTLIAFLLICSAVQAQSITVSRGHGSFVVSGSATAEQPVEIFTEVTPPKPVVRPIVQPVIQQAVTPQQWYLVSESWCPACPAAKKRFLGKGWSQANILTIAECKARFGFSVPHVPYEFGDPSWSATKVPDVIVSSSNGDGRFSFSAKSASQPAYSRPASVMYGGRSYSGRVCSNPNCAMCNQIQRGLQQYQPMAIRVEPPQVEDYGQEPSSMDVVQQAIALMNLTQDDVFADLGCGDGKILIAAVQASGCTAVGIEIDAKKAGEAWENVKSVGLDGKITIIIGDARNFDTKRWKTTALFCYLYPELLAELRDKFESVRIGVTPYHSVDGLTMKSVGDLWVYTGSQ